MSSEGAERISIEVPSEVLRRVERLLAGRQQLGEAGDLDALYEEAFARGLLLLEVEHNKARKEAEARRLNLDETPIPDDEARQAFARETGEVTFGTRRFDEDRRGGRPATTGRRADDHEKARRAFVGKVLDLLDEGVEDAEVARRMNDEGFTTSRGEKWTADGIAQLAKLERQKQKRNVWTPPSLKR